MGALPNNMDGDFANELEEELMKYTTNQENYKVGPFLIDQTEEVNRNADMEIDIMERTKCDGNEVIEAECANEIEGSSSFDDSDSEALCHSEAYASDLEFDEWFINLGRMRKKKVTTHWRSYIQPLMWRCKWTEMQIEKLKAQAREYDKKLEICSQQKQAQFDESALENLGVKSIPFSSDYATSKVLRRKKRRRDEATMDVAAYMSRHNIFSYYENRKLSTKDASMDNELKNPEVKSEDELWGNDEPLCLESGVSDNFIRDIFQKIRFLESRVGKMKCRLDKVTSDAQKLSFIDNLSPCEGLIDIHQDEGAKMSLGSVIASQLVSEYNTGNEPIGQRAVMSHGDVAADLNGSSNHVNFAGAYGNEEEEVLIDNQRVKEEMMNSYEKVKVKTIQRPPPVLKNGSGLTTRPVMIKPNVPTNNGRPPRVPSFSKRTLPKRKAKSKKATGMICAILNAIHKQITRHLLNNNWTRPNQHKHTQINTIHKFKSSKNKTKMKGPSMLALVALLAITLLVAVQPGQADVACNQVDALLIPCADYITGGGGDTPSSKCCDGVKAVKGMAKTSADLRDCCRCVKSLALSYANLKDAKAQSLPAKCGVQLDIPISRSVNCDKINEMSSLTQQPDCRPHCCDPLC